VGGARVAGASWRAGASAALLLTASPTLLHELAWGRMATFLFWPGLLALGAAAGALRAREPVGRWLLGLACGALLGLQLLGYPYHGLVAGLLVLPVLLLCPGARDRRAVLVAVAIAGALVAAPWLLSTADALGELARGAPPAGYTSLPLAGVLGLPSVPERFRLLPLALPLALVALWRPRARPWALAGLLGLLVALGPRPCWDLASGSFSGPLDWLMGSLPLLARMHHPVRCAPLALGALAVAAALLLDPLGRGLRRPGWQRGLGAAGLASLWVLGLAYAGATERVTSWRQPASPQGIGAARWLRNEAQGPVIDLMSGQHMAGLSLQPWHQQPLLETVVGYAPAPGGSWTAQQQASAATVAALATAQDPSGFALTQLRQAGFRHLLLVARHPPGTEAPDLDAQHRLLQARCGRPQYADDESWVYDL